jgi:hypothetical protein
MRKLRIFVAEVVGVAILLGWLFWKYPDVFDSVVPWMALVVMWHVTWEFILDPLREWLAPRVGKARPMVWIYAFVIGGLISVGYLYSIKLGIRKLAESHAAPLGVSPSAPAPEVSPVAGLSELGWTVQPGPDDIQFEIVSKPLPSMKESAAYFGKLHKPFRLHFQSIKGIDGLHYLAGITGCTKVEINAGEFTDLSDLQGFSSLTSLIISQTPLNGLGVIDLTPISSLTNLRELNLHSTKVTSIAALTALTKLEVLNLKATLVHDLSPIAGFLSLKSLDVTDTDISQLGPLSHIETMEELGIGGKQIPSLVSLTNLKHLKTLRIIDQNEIDLSPVGELPSVEYLWIWGPPRLNVSPLCRLINLHELTLQGLGVGKLTSVAEIDQLGRLSELRKLTLGSLQVSDLTFTSKLKHLNEINIGMMPVSSIESLRGLRSLRSVSLNLTPVVDISPLLELPALASLSVIRTPARADVLTELERRGVRIQR